MTWSTVLAVAIVGLALLLRLYRADAQSLWYDEGTSVALAGRSLAAIADGAAHDIHPPLYYILLAAWVRLFGNGVVAVRALSALLGASVVALVYAIGRRWAGAAVGLFAAGLAAVSPYLVWYSQEVRMYMLVALLACGLVYATLRLIDASDAARAAAAVGRLGPNGWAIACGTLSLLVLYTHYFGAASALAVANAVLLLAVVRAWRATRGIAWPLIGRWVAAQSVAALLFLPWLRLAWPTLHSWPAVSPPVSASYVAGGSALTFALGTQAPAGLAGWLGVGVVVAGIGVGAGLRREWRWLALVATLWTVLPPTLMWLLSLVRPAWNPKFLIVAAPGFELLMGLGLAAIARLVARSAGQADERRAALLGGAVAGLVMAVLVWPRTQALAAMYFDPAHQRDDYRGIAQDIDTSAGPADAVVLNAPTQVELFDYYDRGRHTTFPLPLERPPDRAATARRLDALGAAQRDIYAILWATNESDPDGLVETWLNQHRFKVADDWHGNVRLAVWAAARPMTDTRATTDIAHFGDTLALTRLARPNAPVAPGELLTLQATWRALTHPGTDYTVFTQLLGPDGQPVAQRDLRPVGDTARTSTWQPSDMPIEDRIGLRVPPGTPPGDYPLILGLYDSGTGRRLPVSIDGHEKGDAYAVGKVTVP